MYKLVVLFAAVATATAAPSTLVAHHGLTAYATPAIHTFGADAVSVVAATPVAVESKVVESPTVVETRTSVGYAPAAALTKQVHYAAQPVVTGYSSSVIKPDLGALATPVHSVLQQQVLAPSRAVHTIVPQVTHVQPELHVRKVAVDVPVETPYVSKVEVHTPHVVAKTAPVIATHHVSNYVAAAPVLSTHVHNIPAVTSYAHGYAHGYAAPALYSLGYSTGYAAGVPTVY